MREPTEAERQAILAVEGGEYESFGAPFIWFAERGVAALYGGYVGGAGYITAHGLTDYESANWVGFMTATLRGAFMGAVSYSPGKVTIFVVVTAVDFAFGYAQAWVEQHHSPGNFDEGGNNR